MSNVQGNRPGNSGSLVSNVQLFILKQGNIRTVSWIREKEACLNNDNLIESIAAVEALVRKHANFVQTMEKQAIIITNN